MREEAAAAAERERKEKEEKIRLIEAAEEKDRIRKELKAAEKLELDK